jgi:uncharacterized secreted repeat protein (TIGR03808 family)
MTQISRRTVLLGLSSLAFANEVVAQDATQLQALINRGGRINLGAGAIVLQKPLTISNPVTIQGVPGQTRIIGKNVESLISANSVDNLFISGISFEGGQTGVALQGCAGGVLNNQFRNQSAMAVFSNDARGLEISGNNIFDIGNSGIMVWQSVKRSDGSIITNNRIARISARSGGSGEYGNGINVFRAGNVIVSNNRISDCTYSGIRNNAGDNCQIIGNSISRAREVGIYVEFGFEGAIVANNILEDVGFGISIANLDVGGRMSVVNGNIIRRVRGSNTEGVKAGGGIYAEADAVISNNIVEDARDFGIGIGWGPYCRNVTATGNLIRNAPIGMVVSVTEGAKQVRISSNMFDGVRVAIEGQDYTVKKTGDLLREKPPRHIYVTP